MANNVGVYGELGWVSFRGCLCFCNQPVVKPVFLSCDVTWACLAHASVGVFPSSQVPESHTKILFLPMLHYEEAYNVDQIEEDFTPSVIRDLHLTYRCTHVVRDSGFVSGV